MAAAGAALEVVGGATPAQQESLDLELEELHGRVVGLHLEDARLVGGEGEHRGVGGSDLLLEVVAVPRGVAVVGPTAGVIL